MTHFFFEPILYLSLWIMQMAKKCRKDFLESVWKYLGKKMTFPDRKFNIQWCPKSWDFAVTSDKVLLLISTGIYVLTSYVCVLSACLAQKVMNVFLFIFTDLFHDYLTKTPQGACQSSVFLFVWCLVGVSDVWHEMRRRIVQYAEINIFHRSYILNIIKNSVMNSFIYLVFQLVSCITWWLEKTRYSIVK